MVCLLWMTRHNSILVRLISIYALPDGYHPYFVGKKVRHGHNVIGRLPAYKTLILILILSINALFVSAQRKEGMPLIDSLLIQVPKTSDDTNKVHLLTSISDAYIAYTQDSLNCEYYLRRAKSLAEKLNFISGIKDANIRFYALYRLQTNSSKAMGYLFNNVDLCKQNKRGGEEAECYYKIGTAYLALHIADKALEYYFMSLKKYELLKDTAAIADIWYSLANDIYIPSKNYAGAVKYLSKLLDYYNRIHSGIGMATVQNALAQICADTKEYDKALKYYQQSYNVFSRYADSSVNSNMYKIKAVNVIRNIGKVYQAEKEYLKAINCYNRCYEEGKKVNFPDHLWLMGLGEVLMEIVKDSTHYLPADSFIPAGNAARLQKAIVLLDSALIGYGGATETAEEIYTYLSEALTMSGRYKDALVAYRQSIIKKDSIFSADKALRLAAVDNKRVLELKDKELEMEKVQVSRKKKEELLYAGGILLLSVFSVFIYRERRKADHERKRSDDLLLNILPAEVAEELKKTGNATARQFDNVTVLFTDFVDFTRASEKMSPQELIDELNICFKAFDGIMGKYGIEKIKTIGDAYLAVAGLPVANPEQTENAVKAAMEIRDYIRNRRKQVGEKTFHVRIGLHTGSVIAGIVGIKKFAYDIWGDTVNMAARMEQHGESGKINVSETTYELIKDKFSCTYRGEIHAKNKGAVKMYFVSPAVASAKEGVHVAAATNDIVAPAAKSNSDEMGPQPGSQAVVANTTP